MKRASLVPARPRSSLVWPGWGKAVKRHRAVWECGLLLGIGWALLAVFGR